MERMRVQGCENQWRISLPCGGAHHDWMGYAFKPARLSLNVAQDRSLDNQVTSTAEILPFVLALLQGWYLHQSYPLQCSASAIPLNPNPSKHLLKFLPPPVPLYQSQEFNFVFNCLQCLQQATNCRHDPGIT